MSRSELDVDNVFLKKNLDSMKRRHEKAEELYDRVKIYQDGRNKNSWIIPSFSQIGEIYRVKRLPLNNHACNVYCEVCEACAHEFSCDCPDARSNSNFCKHMHILCLNDFKTCGRFDSRNLGTVVNESNGNEGESAVNSNLIKSKFKVSLYEEARAAVDGLVSLLDQATSDKTYKEIIQTIRKLKSKIETFEGGSSSSSIIDPCT